MIIECLLIEFTLRVPQGDSAFPIVLTFRFYNEGKLSSCPKDSYGEALEA